MRTSVTRDDIRVEAIRRSLDASDLDALVCALPNNVLLLSGYWPAVGTALAVATREGRALLIAPDDEMDVAERALADEVRKYRPQASGVLSGFPPGSPDDVRQADDALRLSLREAAVDLAIERGRIGYERGPSFVPASRATMRLYGASIIDLLRHSLPAARLRPADELLAKLRAMPTPAEAARIRLACRIAEQAFLEGARQLREGMWECEVAAVFRAPLMLVDSQSGVRRADGFVSCMSGVNSARGYGGGAHSRDRKLAPGDFVMVHCDSHADGYWTTITRTFVMGEAGPRKLEMYGAVHAASHAAIGAIRPGVMAADVDAAAREALVSRGFGDHFKHATGHAVGFAAMDYDTPPRLRPMSDDRLETGMIFNIEPAIYVEGFGGLRHCDTALVTETGVEILTPFQSSIEHLVVRSSVSEESLGAATPTRPAAMV